METRLISKIIVILLLLLSSQALFAQQPEYPATVADSVGDLLDEEKFKQLNAVTIVGKSEGKKLKEGALNVNAVEIKADINRMTNLNSLVNRSAGVKVRREGGAGSDLDLSINGLSGNSIRYFIDGVPLDSRGSEVNLDNIPINTVERVELYKGVVPIHLSSDALGGVVNIVTKKKRDNYLDASYGVGSFHSQTVDLAGQVFIPKTAVAIRPSFEFSSSKNDYKMKGVEIWSEEQDKYIFTDKKRFHDDYLSINAGIEAGVSNVKWADAFFINGGYTKINKEIQTGAMQNKVYGMAERHSHAWYVGARYAKAFGKVGTRLNFSHTWDHSETVDTAYRKYSWDGTWMPSSGNEMRNGARTWRVYQRPLTVLNASVDYEFIENHSIAFAYMLNRRGNKQTDRADKLYEPTNDVITKHILSLAYNHSFFDERWQNMFFVKDYINSTSIKQTENATITGANDIDPDATKSYWGAGVGSRFTLRQSISFKGSYEHSVRLPLSRELLGNGTTVLANLAIKPEESNNYNIGVFGTWYANDENVFTYELNGFIRHVQNYIRASVSEREGYMQYQNEPAIKIKGLDFDLGYMWNNRLNVKLNGSWNDARNMRKYKTDGNPSATYKNRVPNKPWLFGNVEVSYTFSDLSEWNDRLRIEADHEWINWYYLNWEAYGAVSSKAKIPTQNITSLSATYSWQKERYNISFECSNLFDRLAYDNYMLQKPGRAFYIKFRLFLH
ncbi:MAG: TonB-dependent receptor plug domain-containing protein [Muribaculum sp.]|nr:TonB-dependent receptor plug domain-containing protein [Muribaculum sp.]